MRILGHRGASAVAPENTRAALREALAAGAAGAEIDVRITADGVVVLLHDERLDRTTTARGLLRTLVAGALAQVDAGSWFGPGWAREPVPRLSEILDEWPHDRRLLIELKDGTELLAPLRDVLANHRGKDLALLAFDGDLLREAGRVLPGWPCYHNVEWPGGDAAAWFDAQLLEAKAAGWQGLSLGVASGWRAQWPHRLREAGLGCAVWTVDDPAVAEQLRADGVEELMTNDPARLLRSGR